MQVLGGGEERKKESGKAAHTNWKKLQIAFCLQKKHTPPLAQRRASAKFSNPSGWTKSPPSSRTSQPRVPASCPAQIGVARCTMGLVVRSERQHGFRTIKQTTKSRSQRASQRRTSRGWVCEPQGVGWCGHPELGCGCWRPRRGTVPGGCASRALAEESGYCRHVVCMRRAQPLQN